LRRRDVGRDLARLLRKGSLKDTTIKNDEDIFLVERVVEDIDTTSSKCRVHGVTYGIDLDGGPFFVHAAALAKPEQLVDLSEVGSWMQLGASAEPLSGCFTDLGVDVSVVSLGEPGLEEGVELIEAQRLVP
jgi:hypothetical protein